MKLYDKGDDRDEWLSASRTGGHSPPGGDGTSLRCQRSPGGRVPPIRPARGGLDGTRAAAQGHGSVQAHPTMW